MGHEPEHGSSMPVGDPWVGRTPHGTALSYRAFRLALTGRVVSSAGSWMQTVAAGWLVYEVTRSATAVGVLTVLARSPGMIFSLVGGDLADRIDRRRLLVWTFVAQAAVALLLAVAAWADSATVAEIYAATLVIGVAGAVASPAMQTMVTDTVPVELRARATALNSLGYNLARLAGPAIGGALTTLAGPGPCFAINAASFLIVIAAVRHVPAAVPQPGAPPALRAAVRQALSTRVLRDLLLIVLFTSLLVAPIQQLTPVLAHDLGDGAHWIGILLSCMAAGGIIGNRLRLLFERYDVSREQRLGLTITGCGIALSVMALDKHVSLACASMVLLGVCWEILFVETLTGIQLEAPDHMTGRAVGLFFTITFGGVSLGALIMGGLLDWLGGGLGLLICAVAVLAAGIAYLVRAIRAPSHEPPPDGTSVLDPI